MSTSTVAVATAPASLKPSTVTVWGPGSAKVIWNVAGGHLARPRSCRPASLKLSKSVNDVPAGVPEVTVKVTGWFVFNVPDATTAAVGAAKIWI